MSVSLCLADPRTVAAILIALPLLLISFMTVCLFFRFNHFEHSKLNSKLLSCNISNEKLSQSYYFNGSLLIANILLTHWDWNILQRTFSSSTVSLCSCLFLCSCIHLHCCGNPHSTADGIFNYHFSLFCDLNPDTICSGGLNRQYQHFCQCPDTQQTTVSDAF